MTHPLAALRAFVRGSLPSPLISAIKEQIGAPDMQVSLQRLRSKGFRPSAIVDIGAYQGWWSETAREVFPDAEIIMVEPLPDRSAQLTSLATRINANYCQALCGSEDDQPSTFHVGSIGSSMYNPKRFNASETITLNTLTLDSLLLRHGLPKPNLIKIDVQGAEEDVLNGASASLAHAEVIILELSIINSYSEGLLAGDMIHFMQKIGFLLHDIAGLNRANRTRSVNEFDAIFVRQGSPLWNLNNFLPIDAPDPTSV